MSKELMIRNDVHNGLIPLVDRRLLPENASQVCLDADLRSGNIVPFDGLTSVQAVTAGTDTIHKYRAHNDGASEWLEFPDIVEIVNSPVNGDLLERIFYTGNSDGKLHQKGYLPINHTYTPHYPVAQSGTYVKATTSHSAPYNPYLATDPALPLIGGGLNNSWLASTLTNQRFHIDLGSAIVINRLYYENHHDSGANTSRGAQNFTLWGSNEAGAFADLTYATDTDWVQITCAETAFEEHIAADNAEPKFILATNTTAYRYYAIKIADNWGDGSYVGLRMIALQLGNVATIPFDRAVYNTPPSTAVSAAVSELFDLASSTADAYFHWSPSAAVWNDTAVTCSYVGMQSIGESVILTFSMPYHFFVRHDATGAHDPSMYYRITLPGGIGVVTVSNVGDVNTLTDNAVDYSDVTIESIQGDTGWSAYGTIFEYNEREFTIQLTLESLFASLQDYFYFQTFVNDIGQEGPISPITDAVRRTGTSRVTLTGLAAPTAGENVTLRRIYRSLSASTTDSNPFNLVVELFESVSSYIDWVNPLSYSHEIRTNPEDDLEGLVSHPARFLGAFVGDTVWLCEPNLPNSWPNKYTIDAPVVGLAINGNDVVVLTIGTPTILSGTNPAAMRMSKMMIEQSCVSKRSICNVGTTVGYASPDGYVFISGGQGRLVTKELIKPGQWDALVPSSMVAVQYNGLIFMSMTGGNRILDSQLGSNAFTAFSETFTVATNDLFDDTLYLVKNDTIYSFNTDGDNPYQARWRCREHDFNTPTFMSKCRVIAESYPTVVSTDEIHLLVFINDSLLKDMTILSDRVYNLPKCRNDKVWSYEVRSYVPIVRSELGQASGDFINV